MTDDILRLAPRSAGAAADTELLRVALADLAPPSAPTPSTLGGRLRALLQRVGLAAH